MACEEIKHPARTEWGSTTEKHITPEFVSEEKRGLDDRVSRMKD